jgi:hypothetical protein
MFNAVALFGALGVVEAVKRSHKISGDAAGALKSHALAHNFLLGLGFLEQTRFHQHMLFSLRQKTLINVCNR